MPNLKSLCSPTTKIFKATNNTKTCGLGISGHWSPMLRTGGAEDELLNGSGHFSFLAKKKIRVIFAAVKMTHILDITKVIYVKGGKSLSR